MNPLDTLLPIMVANPARIWDLPSALQALQEQGFANSKRTLERHLADCAWLSVAATLSAQVDELGRQAKQNVLTDLLARCKRQRVKTYFASLHPFPVSDDPLTNRAKSAVTPSTTGLTTTVLVVEDGRGSKRWTLIFDWHEQTILSQLSALLGDQAGTVLVSGELTRHCRQIPAEMLDRIPFKIPVIQFHEPPNKTGELVRAKHPAAPVTAKLNHLARLEAESLHILREAVASAENPVMLYSIGKDSSVMLHLARKAFYPSPPPFPLLHVDTGWKFQAMYDFRDQIATESAMDLIVHQNPEGVAKDINPFDHGSALHTDIMKTQGLKQALDQYQFDVAFGGARRDEEKSRAKERVFSFRSASHRWDPKNQRPELWNLYNCRKAPGESVRVFPLSNWTELDIWQYIYQEQIDIVPLYFAAERPVIQRNGMLMMVDDDRLKLLPGEIVETRKVRFRTLGCYPLTGAIESSANNLSEIVLELLQSRTSERQGRAIDNDAGASMEQKKQEGYF